MLVPHDVHCESVCWPASQIPGPTCTMLHRVPSHSAYEQLSQTPTQVPHCSPAVRHGMPSSESGDAGHTTSVSAVSTEIDASTTVTSASLPFAVLAHAPRKIAASAQYR